MTQERRRGAESHLSGSRLSGTRSRSLNGPPIAHEAAGRAEKWRPEHCDSCAVPATNEKLLTFRLWSVEHAKWAGAWTLCQKCFEWRNDRPDPDPLHVDEDAA